MQFVADGRAHHGQRHFRAELPRADSLPGREGEGEQRVGGCLDLRFERRDPGLVFAEGQRQHRRKPLAEVLHLTDEPHHALAGPAGGPAHSIPDAARLRVIAGRIAALGQARVPALLLRVQHAREQFTDARHDFRLVPRVGLLQ